MGDKLTREALDFRHTTYEEVETRLLDGHTPREISDALDEPLPNIIGVWSILRDEGKVKARNFPPAPSVPQPRTVPHAIIERGLVHPQNKVKRLAERAQTALLLLEAEFAKYDAQAKARAAVERLERELAAAREALRSGTSIQTGSGTAVSIQPASRRSEPVDCPGCGRTLGSKTGLLSHQRATAECSQAAT